MPESILAVEYEPRYIERIRQALSALPYAVVFAKDGAEAVNALNSAAPAPKLIILSSVIPKMSTLDLIRNIRSRDHLRETPILLTVSGYTGKSPAADAQRIGASELVAKPYAEPDLLAKVQHLLGIEHPAPVAAADSHQYTSGEIFGDIIDDDAPLAAAAQPRKLSPRAEANLDKMLADTLADVMPGRKPATMPGTTPRPADRPRTQPGNSELDKLVSDTLSGLERSGRKPGGTTPGTSPGVPLRPAPSTPAAPTAPTPGAIAPSVSAAAPQPVAAPEPPMPDRVPVSQPILRQEKEQEETPAPAGTFGQYTLVEKIATGGMAEVWKARMLGVEGFQKIVAIKKILPHLSDNRDFIEMFVDEAKLAAQLNHNNITHIYDLGKLQDSYYIAMEFIDGFDLKTILHRAYDRGEPMSVELALFIASKVAAALDYAHRKRDFEDHEMGIVHRDVSPQNVLISQEGDIKLCDFGIAKAASKASHTQAGALKGKLQYMSPEQAWGRAIDRRSDVFALGSVLFEMLTGDKLFSGENEMSVIDQVREAVIRPPSEVNDEVPPEVDRIVTKALAKDPADRYQSAGEMVRDIDAILYSFKPTPTSADLAIYLDRLWAAAPVTATESAALPSFDAPKFSDAMSATPHVIVATPAAIVAAPVATASVVAAVAPPKPVSNPAAAAPWRPEAEEETKKKSPLLLAAMAAGILAIGVGAGVVFLGGKEPVEQPDNPAARQTTSAAAIPQTTVPLVASETQTVPALATDTALDATLVDREVQRRLAAERARLEQQARAQAPQAAPAEVTRAAATPQQQVPPTATVAPEPVAQTATQQVAPPPAAAPTATVAETREAPATAQPQPQRAREGDLIAAGTAGLAPPRVLRQGSVPYPPMARMQRVQGTVLVNVLVSETGSVLQTRVVRGVNRPVGLNEAAEQAMRRSTFAPGTKDGVRVRSWISVPVEFKL